MKKRGCRRQFAATAWLLLMIVIVAFYLKTSVASLNGTVIKVVDGDTCDIRYQTWLGSRTERVRLAAVDAPERGQPYWRASRDFINGQVLNRQVQVVKSGSDRYGRTLGHVYYEIDGKSHEVNSEIVAAGLAWWYEQYAPLDTRMSALQAEARSAHRGLWSESDPIAPWDYRSSKSN